MQWSRCQTEGCFTGGGNAQTNELPGSRDDSGSVVRPGKRRSAWPGNLPAAKVVAAKELATAQGCPLAVMAGKE